MIVGGNAKVADEVLFLFKFFSDNGETVKYCKKNAPNICYIWDRIYF
jgi:hypothetical protein